MDGVVGPTTAWNTNMKIKKYLGAATFLLLLILQVGIVYGLRMLDYLSKRKAGVNHHLMVRKGYYDHNLFAPTNRIVMIVVIVLVIAVLVYFFLREKNRWSKISLGTGALFAAFGAWALVSKTFGAKLFFPYAMAGVGILFVIELVKLLVAKKLLSE